MNDKSIKGNDNNIAHHIHQARLCANETQEMVSAMKDWRLTNYDNERSNLVLKMSKLTTMLDVICDVLMEESE